MKLTRKDFLKSAAAAALAAPLGATGGFAQEYPSQDIRLICGFPPGSGSDVLVRYFAEKLRPIANRTIIVENKVGAAGLIATEFVARSKPDGHVLFPSNGTTVAATKGLFKNPSVDVGKALTVAGTTCVLGFMLVVDAKSPYGTVAELTEAMKKKGDKASYATAAIPATIMGEIYKQKTGVQAVEINFKNPPDSLNEILSGKIDYGMHDPVFSLAQQREGRFRILAIGTGERLQSLPHIPTMKESGVPMELDLWWGVMLPSGTPRPIIDKVNQWFSQIASQPDTMKFLNNVGFDPMIRTPDQAQQLFQKSIEEWVEYARIAKIQPL